MTDMNPNAHERILALEKIRVVETQLIELSLPLIRRLTQDLDTLLGSTLPAPALQSLQRGEEWWRAADTGFRSPDPRSIPVVAEMLTTVEKQFTFTWEPDLTNKDGVSYADLVPPLIEALERRTELARIAQVP